MDLKIEADSSSDGVEHSFSEQWTMRDFGEKGNCRKCCIYCLFASTIIATYAPSESMPVSITRLFC